jgi:predicted nuclease of predicted toxin-antitoxin system
VRDRTPRSLILVLDENLSGKIILAGLRTRGLAIRAQTEFMAKGIDDATVLRAMAQHPDCCLLTRDSDFRRHPTTRQVLLECGIGVFVITAQKHRTGDDLVELIARAWPRMQTFLDHHDPPFVATVHADGRVTAGP